MPSKPCARPTASCVMGVDSTAVVDRQLRVHGLSGFRIPDAFIMLTRWGLPDPIGTMSVSRLGVRRKLLAGRSLNLAGGIVCLMIVLGNYHGLEAVALLSGIAIAIFLAACCLPGAAVLFVPRAPVARVAA